MSLDLLVDLLFSPVESCASERSNKRRLKVMQKKDDRVQNDYRREHLAKRRLPVLQPMKVAWEDSRQLACVHTEINIIIESRNFCQNSFVTKTRR